MGAIEKNILAQAKRFNEPIPERIKNKPKLALGLSFFMEAFIELDTDRDVGMGLGAIPWSSLHNYAVANDLTGEDYEDLIYLVRKLDTAYIDSKNSKGGADGQPT